jgi:hypothetical protein
VSKRALKKLGKNAMLRTNCDAQNKQGNQGGNGGDTPTNPDHELFS